MAKPAIKTIDTQGSFEAIVSSSSKEVAAIARALRTMIADVYPGVTEVP